MTLTLASYDAMLKDLHPRPGTRIKQWVADTRREAAWEYATCPRFDIEPHDDNTGAQCRNVGPTPWTFLDHDCCETCCDKHQALAATPRVDAWVAEKMLRPPVETDRAKFSNEVEGDWPSTGNSLLAKLVRK